MESVMWAFRTLCDKGLIYKGYRVLWYCWRCETRLSNTETKMDDVYRDRQDPAVTVALPHAHQAGAQRQLRRTRGKLGALRPSSAHWRNSSIVAVDGPRVRWIRTAARSTSRITRRMLSPKTFFTSSSVYPRRISSAVRYG
jgi:tRNA synthetase class I (I, L, M and V)